MVIAFYSHSRRKRRKPHSMTIVDYHIDGLYSRDERLALRRTMLRCARSFPPGDQRDQHLHMAVSLRALFKDDKWLRDHLRNS